MSDGFRFPEKEVAERLGVSREQLKAIREGHMERGADFELAGGQICLSEEGVRKLAVELGLTGKDGPAAGEQGELPLPAVPQAESPGAPAPNPLQRRLPAAAGGQSVRMGRVKKRCKNKHIVLVESEGETVRLRVKDNAKFVKGFEVPMRLIQEPDIYELTRRAPRWKGKW